MMHLRKERVFRDVVALSWQETDGLQAGKENG
jgi:hypothetical protein